MKYMNEQQPKTPLSPEMQQVLQEEAIEAEILAAMDAAAEEGMHITREDAIDALLSKEKNPPPEYPAKKE